MSPTISQVISSGNNVSFTSGFTFLALGGVFLAAAVVTAVKGYTVYKNKKDVSDTLSANDSVPDLLNLELKENKEKIDELSLIVDELRHEIDGLLAEKETFMAKNEALLKDLEEHIDNFDGLKLSYDILYRNNFKTAKECEKLRGELERAKKIKPEMNFGKPIKLVPLKAGKNIKKKAESGNKEKISVIIAALNKEKNNLKKEGNRKLKVSQKNASNK